MTQSWPPWLCALQQQNLVFVGPLSVSGTVALHPPIGVHVALGSLRTTRTTFWDQNTHSHPGYLAPVGGSERSLGFQAVDEIGYFALNLAKTRASIV